MMGTNTATSRCGCPASGPGRTPAAARLILLEVRVCARIAGGSCFDRGTNSGAVLRRCLAFARGWRRVERVPRGHVRWPKMLTSKGRLLNKTGNVPNTGDTSTIQRLSQIQGVAIIQRALQNSRILGYSGAGFPPPRCNII